jgi:hypothetical protein
MNDGLGEILPSMSKLITTSHYVCQPFIETSSIYRCMRTVHADAFLSQSKEGVLLGIGLSKRLQWPENDWILDLSAVEYLIVFRQ